MSFLSICLYDAVISLCLYDAEVSLGLYDSDLSEGLYDAGSNNFDIGVFWQKWRDNYDEFGEKNWQSRHLYFVTLTWGKTWRDPDRYEGIN